MRETTAVGSPGTATKTSSHSLQLEKALEQQWRFSTAKKKKKKDESCGRGVLGSTQLKSLAKRVAFSFTIKRIKVLIFVPGADTFPFHS